MKISMLSTLPPIKGISDYTSGLVEELSKKCEIDFYGFKSIYPEFLYPGGTKSDKKEPKIENLNIYNYLTWYNPFSWIKTGLAIKTKILHVQWWSWVLAPMFLTILGIAKLRKKRIIMTIHNVKPHEKSLIKNFLNKSVIGLATEYIVHSKNNKEMFLKEIKTKKRVSVIPHGITKIKEPPISTISLRKEYGFSDDDKILLFFGTIREYKGLDILLEALKLIKDEKVKLLIAGKPWEKFERYNNIIKDLNINSRVKLFLGFIIESKVAELFKISDVVVLPYKDFEASSGVGSIILGFNMPLVITKVGGLPELVINKRVIAKPRNSTDLSKKLIYALNNLGKLKLDSTKKLEEFSWDNLIRKLIEVYK